MNECFRTTAIRRVLLCLSAVVGLACHARTEGGALRGTPAVPAPPASRLTVGRRTDVGYLKIPTGWSVWPYRGRWREPVFVLIPGDEQRYRIVVRAIPSSFYDPDDETMQEFLERNATVAPWPPATRTVAVQRSASPSPACISAETADGVLAACGVPSGSAVVYAQVFGISPGAFSALGGVDLLYEIAESVSFEELGVTRP